MHTHRLLSGHHAGLPEASKFKERKCAPWQSRSAHHAERPRHGALFVSLNVKAAKPCRCCSLAIA